MFATDGYFLSPTLDPDQVQDSYATFNCALAVGDPRPLGSGGAGQEPDRREIVAMGVGNAFVLLTFGAYSQTNMVGEGRTFTLQGRFKF